jgi:starvation-inducible DNA-binding protein
MKADTKLAGPLVTIEGRNSKATDELATSLNALLADMFALYLKTKNFHWHVSGRHFRDYHLLLDAQADQIFATTDAIAERVRKIGAKTVRSVGHVAKLQRIADNNAEEVAAADMLRELRDDNATLAFHLKAAHSLCDQDDDIASAGLIETWLDEAEQRIWFLFEAGRG